MAQSTKFRILPLLKEAATEQAGENLDGGQEGAAPGLPFATVDIEAGVGHDHMQMGMEQQLLVPGMQNGGPADEHAPVPGICGDRAQGLGYASEQDDDDGAPSDRSDGGPSKGSMLSGGQRQSASDAHLPPRCAIRQNRVPTRPNNSA